LEVSIGIQLDDIDIGSSCAEGGGVAGDGVAAIGGLNEGVAFLTLWSADSLTEVGREAGGRDGIGGEGGLGVCILRWRIRAGGGSLHAFCVGSVAATKSAKDKGFSRFFHVGEGRKKRALSVVAFFFGL
jgi:hypothetical protein